MKTARLLAAFLLAGLPLAVRAQTELSAPAVAGEGSEIPVAPQPGFEQAPADAGPEELGPAPAAQPIELDLPALRAPQAAMDRAPAQAGAAAREPGLAAREGRAAAPGRSMARHASLRATLRVADPAAGSEDGKEDEGRQAERLGLLFDLGGFKTGDAPISLEVDPALDALRPEAGGFSTRGRRVVELAGRSPALAAAPENPAGAPSFKARWEGWTQRLTDAANFFFLPFSLPQIFKNAVNIHHGAYSALSGLPWTGYASGILGNLFLMSVALSVKDASWARVQAIGWTTAFVVLSQVFYAGYMPGWAFASLTGVIASFSGLSLADRRGWLKGNAKTAWDKAVRAAGWLATFLFMYAPAAFLWSIFTRPASAAGIASWGFVLGMLGNLVMLPQAARTKNFMWFLGSASGVLVGGVAILASLFFLGQVPGYLMLAVALGVPASLALLAVMTKKYFGLKSILQFRFRG